jgi:tetratricopeptide (TPR) repeat protein
MALRARPPLISGVQQALALFGNVGHRIGEACGLCDLGVVQQQTGDYPGATVSFDQALELFRDFGDRPGEARTLTFLGDLSSRTAGSQQVREHYARALAIARDIGLPLEEASALEGIGHIHLQEGTTEGRCHAPATGPCDVPAHRGTRRHRGRETLRRHRLYPAQLKPPTSEESANATPGKTC